MPIDHTEKGFENAIESFLIQHGGYAKEDSNNFDRNLALNKQTLFSFLKSSQPKECEKLQSIHGNDFETKLLDRLTKELDSRGILDVIRNGIVDYGVRFKLAYFKPASQMNSEALQLYQKNILTITRQVRYDPNSEKSVDIVLSINGLPVATLELKNPLTGQTVEDAKKQYMYDRNPNDLLFQFKKRILVHFAVDPDEVYMTTKLQGKNTNFLPFNKGLDDGAGNPENPNGYKTSYLWESVLNRESWLDILARFIQLEVLEKYERGTKIIQEKLIFPRYHQLMAVRSLVEDAKNVGAGKNYLIQHSAGSGKSNSIAWLAHRLSNLHDKNDKTVFDSVVVITDRVILDEQLQNTIYQFEHKLGVVERIDKDSKQLASALTSGKRIIITTMQKFPFVIDKIGKLPKRNYALIVDEAHSSQAGETAKAVKEVLSVKSLEEAEEIDAERERKQYDPEEEITKSMASRGRQPNLSFFAFTATPKAKTLELFGKPGPDGTPVPFHLYSMKQAIEEGFILDVLQNYTTYKTYFRVVEHAEKDKKVDRKKAAIAIARFVNLHEHNLNQKTQVIVEHFRNFSFEKIGEQAKAMIVTRSRLHAVKYKIIIDEYLKEKEYNNIKTLVAFSGVVKDGGIEYKESTMNGFGEKQLPKEFEKREYQILIVADKYQTGYDQPLLHTMYVDKRLSGIKAVQTLSRLNRTYPGKEDTLVLDFVNDEFEIQKSFEPYYKQTFLTGTVDHNLLYGIENKIETFRILDTSEVDQFCNIYFNPNPDPQDQGLMNSVLDRAVKRFKTENGARQEEFKNLLVNYVRQYSFLCQLIAFEDIQLEKLYAYARFLIKKLPLRDLSKWYSLGNDIALEYYRLQKLREGSISLESDEGLKPPKDTGKRSEPEELVPLFEVIKELNKKFGNFEFNDADKLELKKLEDSLNSDKNLILQAETNSKENFKYPFTDAVKEKVNSIFDSDPSFYEEMMDNEPLQEAVIQVLLNRFHQKHSPERILTKLRNREDSNLEVKASFRYDIDLKQRNNKLEKVIAKTVAAFMNAKGGSLFIGVSDSREVIGLQNDYALLKKQNSDGFEIELRQSIQKYLIDKIVQESINVTFHNIENHEICEIFISPSTKPIVLHDEGKEECYVREGNSSNPFTISQFLEYCKRRF